MRTKREKTFGTPARALTNADRGRIKQAAHDYNVANRQPRQHNGPLTHATLVVLDTLLFSFHHQTTGACFPSYDAISERSGVSRTMVGVAIKALEMACILTWSHRLGRAWVRVQDELTGETTKVLKVVRRSNAYVFSVPPAPAKAPLKQDAQRRTELSASLASTESGNQAGPNTNNFYATNQFSNRLSAGMGDALKAALDSLGNHFQT